MSGCYSLIMVSSDVRQRIESERLRRKELEWKRREAEEVRRRKEVQLKSRIEALEGEISQLIPENVTAAGWSNVEAIFFEISHLLRQRDGESLDRAGKEIDNMRRHIRQMKRDQQKTALSKDNQQSPAMAEIFAIQETLDSLDESVFHRVESSSQEIFKQIHQIGSYTHTNTEHADLAKRIHKKLKMVIAEKIKDDSVKIEQCKQIEKKMILACTALSIIINSPLNNIDDLKKIAEGLYKDIDSLYDCPDIKKMTDESRQLCAEAENIFKTFQTVYQQEAERSYIVEKIENVLTEMGYEVLDAPYQPILNYKAPVILRIRTPMGEGVQLSIGAEGETFVQMRLLIGENEESNIAPDEIEELRQIEKELFDSYTVMIEKLKVHGVFLLEDSRRYFINPADLPVIRIPDFISRRARRKALSRKKNEDIIAPASSPRKKGEPTIAYSKRDKDEG